MSIKQPAPSFSQITSLPLEDRDLRTAEACQAIGCKKTKLFDLIAAGEVDSYLDGTVRKITGTTHNADELRKVADFLFAVANAVKGGVIEGSLAES